MNALKQKILDELMEHLSNAQGGELKSLLDESKKPEMGIEGMPGEKPKGLKIESVEVMGKPKMGADDKIKQAIEDASSPKKEDPMSMGDEGSEASKMPGEEEMSDEELQELIKKYLS
jgi:hypothetical protein